MRFIKSTRHPFIDTARKQKAERDAMPLFAAEIAAGQRSADDVMQARAESWAVGEARTRQRRAERWRQARREIDATRPPDPFPSATKVQLAPPCAGSLFARMPLIALAGPGYGPGTGQARALRAKTRRRRVSADRE